MKTTAALLFAAWLIAAPSSWAQLSFSLAPSVQNSAAGQTLVFSGTLVNTGSTQLFLNNVAFTLDGNAGAALVSGSNPFYANVPGILLAGGTYSGQVFSEALAAGASPADYTGSVALEGGSNIFTSGTLGTTGFTILSPAVNIVATSGSANEYGPLSGAFTISRTGGTEITLPVSYAIAGSAINGSDYQSIAGSATIAAGASSRLVTITPILQQSALGNRTVTLTSSSSSQYNLGADLSDTVTIYDTPFNQWRIQNFGASANAAQAAPTAYWTAGGIKNLLAYALGINPKNPNPSLLPSVSVVSDYLTLSYAPNTAATDVTYAVQASTDLVNWSAANIQSVNNPTPGMVSFRYNSPLTASRALFLRLCLTQLDW